MNIAINYMYATFKSLLKEQVNKIHSPILIEGNKLGWFGMFYITGIQILSQLYLCSFLLNEEKEKKK